MSRPHAVDRNVCSVARKKVAIVGSGSAGIAALWALNRTHHDVYLYEAADRLGGHTNTVRWRTGKYSTAVDAGFIAFSTATSPNFLSFLKKVKVKTMPSSLTFGVSRDSGLVEWAGASLDALFCQRRRIFSLRLWCMIFDVVRFNQFALDLLINDDVPLSLTIGQYLDREGYSDAFRDDYLVPLAVAVWAAVGNSCCALEIPAVAFVRFMWNNHLLSTLAARRPAWLALADGSQSYIDTVMRGFPPNHLFLRTPVRHARSTSDGRVQLQLQGGSFEVYDHVILACHGDQALSIVNPDATALERDILSSFKTCPNNVVVLHSDASLMPRCRKAWAGWNYLGQSSTRATAAAGSLTYNMNMLQSIPTCTFGEVFVTLNPLREPDPAAIQGRFEYRHFAYTSETMAAQKRLGEIQNTRCISFAGAWTGHGLHEDGFSSGLAVARDHLGTNLPFEFVDATHARARRPVLGLDDLLLRVAILVAQLFFGLLVGTWQVVKDKARRIQVIKKNGITKTQGNRTIRGTANGTANGNANGSWYPTRRRLSKACS